MKKMIKKSFCMVVSALLAFSVFAEGSKEYVKQEINANDRCLPTFYESILKKWDFSMGWKDGNPKKWKKAGLEKARELIIQNEDKTPFDMVVIDEEQREGYKAQKIVFNISEESRILAYLLIPDGAKKAPAALMLHDHGSKFTIGRKRWSSHLVIQKKTQRNLPRLRTGLPAILAKDSSAMRWQKKVM